MGGIRSLVVARWRPHRPDGGAALRNAQNIAGLAALGPVDVVSVGLPEPAEPVPGLRRWVHFGMRPRPAPRRPLLPWEEHPRLAAHRHAGAEAFLRAGLAARDWDLALVEELPCAGYLPLLRSGGLPVIFDDHNVEAVLLADLQRRRAGTGPLAGLRRLRQGLQERRMRRAEGRAVRGADQVWACSAGDAGALARLYAPAGPVRVVPNAVDVAAFAAAREGRCPPAPGGPLRLVFTGTFAYPPNEAAALRLGREILPALRARGAAARLALVGRDPTAAMRAMAAADPDVTVTGAVAHIAPHLSGDAVMAVPLAVGSGTRFKILEAFAALCPVVSTAKGAEGIGARDGEHLLIREDAEGFAAALLGLRAEPGRTAAMTRAAFDLVARSYSWEAAGREIAAAVAALARPGRAGG